MGIQMDINNLKTVNDVYGHAEDDKQIITAAEIISSCFSKLGFCYRTGGDEFMVLITEKNDIEAAFDRLNCLTEKYNSQSNPPVPLNIAVGYSEFSGNKLTLEDAERIADEKMYEKKKEDEISEQMKIIMALRKKFCKNINCNKKTILWSSRKFAAHIFLQYTMDPAKCQDSL